MFQSQNFQPQPQTVSIDQLVRADGTGAHAYVNSGKLDSGPNALRNLADAVHFLSTLHGRCPGVVDLAARKTCDDPAIRWLRTAVSAFVGERNYLAQLAARVGPLPSTSGQAECESAVKQQAHTLEMLAQSDRQGCAVGAAMALVIDWVAVRALMDQAARRLDLRVQPNTMPDLHDTLALAQAYQADPRVSRAFVFGARQLIDQHRTLWDLLSARELART